MQNRKTEILKVRLTPEEKQKFRDYAEKYDMTLSEVIRHFCNEIFCGRQGGKQ